jgi:peptidoglycan/xylan/chitin deacetylase (PgdA/CDA1 family)
VVSLTFDHLGEAAALEQNRWPADQPIGQHYSVTRVMPRLLDCLGGLGVQATFFVEGWNTSVYPDTLRAIVATGHEVGYHGWRHESWARLTDAEARALLDRGVTAFSGLGIQPRGLRAPGGAQPESSLGLLAEYGFSYFSLPGHAPTLYDGLVSLPYEWHYIDAFYYSPRLRELREARGAGSDALPPERLLQTLDQAVDDCLSRGGYLTLLFHTQLLDEEPRFGVFQRIVERVAGSPEVWCAPHQAVAAWMRAHPDRFPSGLSLDDASWDPADFT